VDEILPILLEDTSCIIKDKNNDCLYMEAYARLWQFMDGDINKIPEPFKEFYKE
jgi:hypothetical protein